eukprot:g2254.t1
MPPSLPASAFAFGDDPVAEVHRRAAAFTLPARASFLQGGKIPFWDIRDARQVVDDPSMRQELHAAFYDGAGCIGLKGVFTPSVMDQYNVWCEHVLSQPLNAKNLTHPKQPDKFVVNDLLERLSADDPELLMALINNDVYNAVLDSLLGFSTIGAMTTHWIKPHGKRQRSHVDYPMHVGSGKFWEASPAKMMDLTTPYQLDHVLPYFSVQAVMASDAMNVINGSTEVVPFSHHIPQLDLRLHDPKFYALMEPHFMNTTLDKGDVFIFNRRLCHRGGENTTAVRRNSCIMQCVWLWGIGQHAIDVGRVIHNLVETRCVSYARLCADKALAERFHLRLKKPFPIDTTQHN